MMTASGTAGHGAELASYFPLADLGAVVVKSLASFEWAGNPAPRVHPAGPGMINAVGLQGPGVTQWLADVLPALVRTGARVVVSIWGRSVDDYRQAAEQLADAPAQVVAVEVNLSCPNLEGRRGIFAHDADLSAEVIAATAAAGRPRWAKLSPNTDRVVEGAAAVHAAGAEAVTLVNTLLGMVINPDTMRPHLAGITGGLSGPAIRPVAVRCVWQIRQAFPDLPIIGMGGIRSGMDALEFILAGANALSVGTAVFHDPSAPVRIHAELQRALVDRGFSSLSEAISYAHRPKDALPEVDDELDFISE